MPSSYTIETVPTPALVIDLPTVERNLSRMAAYTKEHGLELRPHTKTHKLLRFAKRQLELGANGLTVAKVGEAEVMAETGADMLLAYPALDAARTSRVAELAKSHTIIVACDSQLAVDALAAAARSAGSTIGILVDIDCGFHRTGLQTPQLALALAQHVDKTDGVRLDGLFTYPGHVLDSAADQATTLQAVQDILQATIDLWREQGLEAKIVSSGSTPTSYQSHHVPAYTEIRPGTYIFNDRNYLAGGWRELDDCAARFICTVISDAVPDKCVLDSGSKTLTSDGCIGGAPGHGLLPDYPDAVICRLSEEHGEVDLSKCDDRPKLGDRVEVIMNHICPCVNLQSTVWLKDADGSLEPAAVDARGLLS